MTASFTPSSRDITTHATTLQTQGPQLEQLLLSLGYTRSTLPPAQWNRFASVAQRHLFLLEPNNYQCDGSPTQRTLLHKLRFPTGLLAAQFIAAMAAKYPDFHLQRCLQPLAGLDDHEVELTHRVLMSAAEVTRAACQALELAHLYSADGDYHWVPVEDDYQTPQPGPITFATWPHRPNRVMRLRTGSYGDTLLIRLILAPWVCRWTDVESRSADSNGVEVAVTTLFGHEVEFEIADDSIKLDDLRWLLNQAVDLHVAAQTLNYVDQYTGERLHYSYLKRIEPSSEVLAALRCRVGPLETALADVAGRLSGLLEDVAA